MADSKNQKADGRPSRDFSEQDSLAENSTKHPDRLKSNMRNRENLDFATIDWLKEVSYDKPVLDKNGYLTMIISTSVSVTLGLTAAYIDIAASW